MKGNKVTTMVRNPSREAIEETVRIVMNDGDGSVFDEDVQAVMFHLNLSAIYYDKVARTLEDIVESRQAAQAFRDDPRAATAKYLDNRIAPGFVDSVIETYDLEAERGIKFLLGLAAL